MGRDSFRDAAVRTIFAGLLLAIFYGGAPFTYRADMAQTLVVAVGITALAVLALPTRGRNERVRIHPMAAVGICLLVWLWLRDSTATGSGELHHYQLAKFTLLGVLILTLVATPERLSPRFVARGLAVGLLLLAAFALAGFGLDWSYPGARFRPPWTLGFGNQNMLGAGVATVTVLASGLALAEPLHTARGWVAVHIAATIAGALILWGTEARAPLFAAMIGGALVVAVRGFVLKPARLLRAMAELGVYIAACGLLLGVSTERFQSKLAVVGTGLSRSETARLYFWRVAWDRLVESPMGFLFGFGQSSFSRAYHAVSPKTQDYVWNKVGTEYLHSEYLEVWHDAGLVALVLLLVLLASTALGLASQIQSEAFDARERGVALALLAALVAWMAAACFDVATRYVPAQVGLALVLGLAWRATGGRALALPRRALAFVAITAAVFSTAVLVPHIASDRMLVLAYAARNANGGPERAEAFAARALAWRPRNLQAAYVRLQLAARRDDRAGASAAYEWIRADTPHFFDTDAIYAQVLAAEGRMAEAAQLMRTFQSLAPYDYALLASLPPMAFAAGDETLLGDSLLDLLADSVRGLEEREKAGHRAAIEIEAGEPTLIVEPGGGRPTLRIRRSAAAGIILGRAPTTLADGRRLVRDGIDRFLEVELGAVERLIGPEP